MMFQQNFQRLSAAQRSKHSVPNLAIMRYLIPLASLCLGFYPSPSPTASDVQISLTQASKANSRLASGQLAGGMVTK